MTADRRARGIGLLLGALLGLAVVYGLSSHGALGEESRLPESLFDEPAAPADRDDATIELFDQPAEPAPPADPDAPAEPAPLTELPETV